MDSTPYLSYCCASKKEHCKQSEAHAPRMDRVDDCCRKRCEDANWCKRLSGIRAIYECSNRGHCNYGLHCGRFGKFAE